MDLVVWGHEHECVIQPAESAIGTFRISQPGSSVATALTEAESIPKCIGILDIKHSQFRLIPIPLMQVRPFSVGQICLANTGLDPDDMRVDQEMADILAREVEKLIQEARSSSRLLKHRSGESSQEGGINGDNEDDNGRNNHDKGDDKSLLKKLSFHVDKPDRVLVRLRVEHSGFPTLHNQRFGSRFVNEVVCFLDCYSWYLYFFQRIIIFFFTVIISLSLHHRPIHRTCSYSIENVALKVNHQSQRKS